MAADTEPLEILLHLPLLAEDKVSSQLIHWLVVLGFIDHIGCLLFCLKGLPRQLEVA